MESRDGGLTDVLPSEGWTLKEEWSVDWSESLNKVYLKQVSAGGSVTFTSTQDEMTFAILVVKVVVVAASKKILIFLIVLIQDFLAA